MKKRPTMLSATFVRTVNVPGRYGDGRGGFGLTLLVQPSKRHGVCKSWGQSVRINGRRTTIGLGMYPLVTLATGSRTGAGKCPGSLQKGTIHAAH